MTVIDYLPVGKEVWPNVLLSQTKKVHYLKGHGLHYRVFNSKYTQINSWEKCSDKAPGMERVLTTSTVFLL